MDEVDPEASLEGQQDEKDLVNDYQEFLERRQLGESSLVQEREEQKMEVDEVNNNA